MVDIFLYDLFDPLPSLLMIVKMLIHGSQEEWFCLSNLLHPLIII